jgi:HAD superfamily hydrolase (TIGR01456 family)
MLRAASRAAPRRFFTVAAVAPAHPLGFVFDIDGVLLRGGTPLPGAVRALARLDAARVPWLLLTNGGGEPEARKAAALSRALGTRIAPEQVVLSHTPMRALCAALGDEKVLLLGCRDVRAVGAAYGLRRAFSAGDVHASDPTAYPFLPPPAGATPLTPADRAAPWGAVLVLHDPNSWGLEIQIAIDVLKSRGAGAPHVPLFCSNGDLTFAGAHAAPRLAAGAFEVALRAVWAATEGGAPPLEATFFGKPTAATFDYAARALAAWAGGGAVGAGGAAGAAGAAGAFARLVMVGDNPRADVRGANAAGAPWTSVLVRSGMWAGEALAPGDEPHAVVDGVADAVARELGGE